MRKLFLQVQSALLNQFVFFYFLVNMVYKS